MACTRSATRAPKAKTSGPSTSGVAKRPRKKPPKKAVPQGRRGISRSSPVPQDRCGIALSSPVPHPPFYRVQIKSSEAEDNILRLCFRKKYAEGLFADLHDDAQAIRMRTNVKLAVCFFLSASSSNTYQRSGALQVALDSLCTCIDDTFRKRAHPATEAHKEFTSQLRRQLDEVVELPDFHNLWPDTLYEKFADIFFPKNSLTREVLDCFRPSFWRPNRRAAYEHLYSSYGADFSDQVLPDDIGRMITECLAFSFRQ